MSVEVLPNFTSISTMQAITSDGEPRSWRISDQSLVAREIADCEEDMLALEKAMIDLKHKRMALNTKMNAVSDPMTILPLDIITEIFAIIIESQDTTDYCSLPAPFLLGRICKAWRNIAWNRPCLWKNIKIQLSCDKYDTQERLLEEWLDRSGTCQLSYNFSCRNEWQPPKSFATLILKTASRWATFRSISSLTSLCDELAHPHTFPILSTLELEMGECNASYLFTESPRLRAFRMSGNGFEIAIPWGRLTRLSMAAGIDLALDVVKDLGAIQTLSINLMNTEELNPQPIVPKSLLHLSNLEMTGRSKLITAVFSAFMVPALSNLKLNFNRIQPNRNALWMAGLKDLHHRSSFSLTTLTLGNIGLEEELALDLLKPFVTLSSLVIDHHSSGLSDLTINRLNPNADGNTECFLPALTHLAYQGRIDFKSRTMTTMLEQRFAVSQIDPLIKPLRVVDITYPNAQWAQTGDHANPNRMQAFYREITNLASRGTVLKVVWDEKEQP